MKKLRLLIGACLVANASFAQQVIPLNDLSAFKTKSENWRIVGDASVDISKVNALSTSDGKGILACIHQQGKYGMDYELFSNLEHGDLDLELDFMLAKGSNSGIYLQGNYEIQLYDSWGKKIAKYNDCGGIYERWNDAKPEGEKGYEGTAPRLNAAKAPGLWQHIKISFQAARFDALGKKTTNAKILKIELNGVTLHENVELTGPTRGSLTPNDVAFGPLRIQGDHGSLAIRNMVITNYDKKAGSISPIDYAIYYGNYKHDADLSKLKIDEKGTSEGLSWEILKNTNDYAFVEKGNYFAPTDGNYTFKLQISGNSTLKIDGKENLDNKWKHSSEVREATVNLTAGTHTFEIFNNKRDGWMKPTLGFWSSGPGFRETPHHALSSLISNKPSDPILVEAKANTNLRSFMDIKRPTDKQQTRVVHAISVGSPDNIHYTYDLDKGAIVQVWRGRFLDATPMWEDRGDGSSRPMGSVTPLSIEMFVGKTLAADAQWKADTTGSGYRPKGYDLDENDLPTFHYLAFGSKIEDAIRITDGKYFTRTVKVSNPSDDLVARIAEGSEIKQVSENLYAIDDKAYYIQLKDVSVRPSIRNINGRQELVISLASGSLVYDLLF